MISQGIERKKLKPSVNHSYFYMPPAWIGSAPGELELGNPASLVKKACSRQFTVGIRIDGHRDGVFLFDFTGWPEGKPITIPAYAGVGGKPLPPPVLEARKLAEDHRYKCMSVMNAHLACMSSAMSRVQGHGVAVRQVITPSAYFTTHWQGAQRVLVGIEPPNDPVLALVAAHFRLDQDIQKQRKRMVIRLDTVEHSFDLLEKILVSTVPDILILTKLLYLAATNYYEHDFPTALTMAWTVCEKLLRVVWNNYIASNDATLSPETEEKRINKDRKKMLTGRDFTASVVSEVLELAGLLKHDTYLKLNEVRRRRNDWLHSMEPITGTVAQQCIRTAERFFKEISGIELEVHLSYGSRL